MKPQIALAILTFSLVSCMPFITELGKTNTPAATEFVNPKVPTPINTPHAIPTSLGWVTQSRSFDLYDERISAFKNTLEFKIRILDVSLRSKADLTLYMIKTEGTITNVSDQPVAITKDLRTGVTVDPEVYWSFSYNGEKLEYIQCCADGRLYIDQDDYIVLQPNEFQRYAWAFSLPVELRNSEGQDVSLSGKPITITAMYTNFSIGYTLIDKDGNIVATIDQNSEPIFYTVDMNAWVGEVQSNSVTYVFP
jgi:hypothetical protein